MSPFGVQREDIPGGVKELYVSAQTPHPPPVGVKTARKPLIVKRLGGKVYSRNEAKIACNALIPGNLDGEIVHSKELSS